MKSISIRRTNYISTSIFTLITISVLDHKSRSDVLFLIPRTSSQYHIQKYTRITLIGFFRFRGTIFPRASKL